MTDGGGIFVALTSCRDEERVEEFLTWYAEVQFRNALAVDGVDAATLYRSTEPGEPGFLAIYSLTGRGAAPVLQHGGQTAGNIGQLRAAAQRHTPHRRDRPGATEYDAYEYAALPVNVPKPGILLCTNGFDADPALSRTGTTTIAVAIRYRRSSGDQRRRDQETSPGEWASI